MSNAEVLIDQLRDAIYDLENFGGMGFDVQASIDAITGVIEHLLQQDLGFQLAGERHSELHALADRISEAAGIEIDFDDLIHDFKSGEAASINNGGLHRQVEYLIEALGEEGARERIMESAAVFGVSDTETLQGVVSDTISPMPEAGQ